MWKNSHNTRQDMLQRGCDTVQVAGEWGLGGTGEQSTSSKRETGVQKKMLGVASIKVEPRGNGPYTCSRAAVRSKSKRSTEDARLGLATGEGVEVEVLVAKGST